MNRESKNALIIIISLAVVVAVLAIGAIVMTIAMSGPSEVQDDGYYQGTEGGGSIFDD